MSSLWPSAEEESVDGKSATLRKYVTFSSDVHHSVHFEYLVEAFKAWDPAKRTSE